MSSLFKKVLKYGLTATIAFASIYLAFMDVHIEDLWDALAGADYKWALVPIPIMLISHWIRALRWKTMLSPIMKVNSVWNLFSAVMVGYLFNNIFPRGGEFIRPYVYSKREKVSYSSTFATIIVERVIDVISLAFLFGLAFIILHDKISKALTIDISPTNIVILVALFFVVIVAGFYPPVIDFFMRKLIKPFSEITYLRLRELFAKFRKGFAIIKKPSQYSRLIIESLLIWFCYALPMYFMFFCFGFQENAHLGLIDAVLLVIVAGIAATIGLTPGSIGVYHVMIRTSMVDLYGISPEHALAYATVTHAINYFVQVGFGALFLMREDITKIPFSEKFMHIDDEVQANTTK